jgi:hypothetical protein
VARRAEAGEDNMGGLIMSCKGKKEGAFGLWYFNTYRYQVICLSEGVMPLIFSARALFTGGVSMLSQGKRKGNCID